MGKIKTGIKMKLNPEQSRKVQEICFENDIGWRSGKGDVQFIDKPFLFIDENISFMYEEEAEDFLKEENEEVDADLFIRTNGTCIEEKQEFTYPMWFKDRLNGHIVEFTEDRVGTVVYSPTGSLYKIGYYSENWASHINDEDYYWQQVENPNLATDKEIEQVINEEYKKDSSINKDKQDMINPSHYKKGGIEAIDYMKAKSTPEEFKGHLRLTALKYLSRYGQKDNELQELEKAKWYLDRLIQELKNEN